MENVLVLMILLVAIVGYRHVRISDLSYLFIFCFLCLHEVGAHYTYDYVPLGYWLKDTFHFARNDYDRIVHFSFGFFWAYPIRELFVQGARTRKFWTYAAPVGIVLSVSAIYEIIEAYMAQLYPGMEEKYVGMQGDVFDSQRDMTCALVGAALSMALAAIAQYEGHLPDDPKAMTIVEPERQGQAQRS
jgi:putative membrane protein